MELLGTQRASDGFRRALHRCLGPAATDLDPDGMALRILRVIGLAEEVDHPRSLFFRRRGPESDAGRDPAPRLLAGRQLVGSECTTDVGFQTVELVGQAQRLEDDDEGVSPDHGRESRENQSTGAALPGTLERMRGRIMYVELKTGYDHNGPAWITWLPFSKTGQSVYFRGKRLRRIPRGGICSNHYDVDTGEEYWASGVKRDRTDRHWAGSGPVHVDDDVHDEYERLVASAMRKPKKTKRR